MSEAEDAERWRALAIGAGADLATLQAVARRVRDELTGRDLRGTVRALSALAEANDALARLVQADIAAVQVLMDAGAPVPDQITALFPFESGAIRATVDADGRWTLDGRQLRSVHPATVGGVLVVAATDEGDRVFLVAMNAPGVVRDRVPMRTIAAENPHGPVVFTGVPGEPVGTSAWWAARPESYEGLLRDCASWFGACVWLCRAVESTLEVRTDPADLVRVGRVDVWVFSARLAMRAALAELEQDPTSPEAELAARRAAAVTATTGDTVIRLVALLSDPRVSREDVSLPTRVAQLQIALQRFDVDANLRALGTLAAHGTADRAANG